MESRGLDGASVYLAVTSRRLVGWAQRWRSAIEAVAFGRVTARRSIAWLAFLCRSGRARAPDRPILLLLQPRGGAVISLPLPARTGQPPAGVCDPPGRVYISPCVYETLCS